MSILMVCCHCLFTEVYISSCDQVHKAHKVGKRLHKVFAPIGLELVAMAHGYYKAPKHIKTLKGE